MPLPINTASLVQEMRAEIVQIDHQIQAIKEDCRNQSESGHLTAESLYHVKYTNGHHVLTDLIVARAGLLAAIANLQAANTKAR